MKSIKKEHFGTLDGIGEVFRYTMETDSGMRAAVLDYGCILQSLYVPDKNGMAENVVLGFDNIEDYLAADGHFGEVVGRCCNRIGGSRFTLDNKVYVLPANDGKNHLHGGPVGFGSRLWSLAGADDGSVSFSLESADGDMGYPGNLTAVCTYTLTDDGKLTLNYKASCDKATPVCLTNHTYFDLCKAGSNRTLDMLLYLDCDKICNTDTKLIPDGTFTAVSGTPYDFTVDKPIGRDIRQDFLLLGHCGGYDTNYFIRDYTGSVRLAGSLSDLVSGRRMKIYTDMPCIQLYTGNMISPDTPPFYSSIAPHPHSGVCLETQVMPDAVNHPGITDTILYPGKTYDSTTIFDFGE